MTYKEFLSRNQFSKEELIAFAYGRLVSDPPAEFSRLPAPPFLMVDRVLEVERQGSRGKIVAEKDVRVDEWFFQCHFTADPVQPGCLGVDAIWQLLGFFCALSGSEGSGRALGCKEVTFNGQIRPYNSLIRYEVDVRRYVVLPDGRASLVVGNGRLSVDGELIYTVEDAKVGMFKGIAYPDYPNRSKNSVGGMMQKDV
jgi:3-hydroxyacyl-[acyl-carrier protein] dehydratase/trans-2-decenoyl-[acyl-carrier protein] isomerase